MFRDAFDIWCFKSGRIVFAAVGASEAIYTIRWANLNQVGRTFQIVVRTTATNSNYELVGIRGDVQPVSRGITPAQWHI